MSIKKRDYRHHGQDEKLRAIELYGQGYGSDTISKKLNVPKRQVSRWILQERAYGSNSFEKKLPSRLSAEQKSFIVRDVLEKSLSCEQVSLKYAVSEYAVFSWVSKVRMGGYGSLAEEKKRGRPPKEMGRPKKKELQTEQERMEEELGYLRAENAYLKKLRALVEERIARESGKSPEPSKH